MTHGKCDEGMKITAPGGCGGWKPASVSSHSPAASWNRFHHLSLSDAFLGIQKHLINRFVSNQDFLPCLLVRGCGGQKVIGHSGPEWRVLVV